MQEHPDYDSIVGTVKELLRAVGVRNLGTPTDSTQYIDRRLACFRDELDKLMDALHNRDPGEALKYADSGILELGSHVDAP